MRSLDFKVGDLVEMQIVSSWSPTRKPESSIGIIIRADWRSADNTLRAVMTPISEKTVRPAKIVIAWITSTNPTKNEFSECQTFFHPEHTRQIKVLRRAKRE